MATVFIPPQLRDLTGGVEQATVGGRTLREVVAELEAVYPGMAARLQEGDRVAAGLAVAIDGETARGGMYARVGPESEIHILPALGGG